MAQKVQNTVHGSEGQSNPGCDTLTDRYRRAWDSRDEVAICRIPELDKRFDRIAMSLDPGEVEKIMREIYRYAYDHYLIVPICELSELTATTKKIAKWDLGHRRQSRNYYDLIKQR